MDRKEEPALLLGNKEIMQKGKEELLNVTLYSKTVDKEGSVGTKKRTAFVDVKALVERHGSMSLLDLLAHILVSSDTTGTVTIVSPLGLDVDSPIEPLAGNKISVMLT